MKPDLKVVPFPDTFADTEKHLRRLADEVANGDFGDDPQIVCVVSGPGDLHVRGLGTTDGISAIAHLNLGLAWLVNNTLKGIEEDE